MMRFMTLFPITLIAVLAGVLAVVFGLTFDHRSWLLPLASFCALNGLVWWILAPFLSRSFASRTRRALDALLNNIAIAGSEAGSP